MDSYCCLPGTGRVSSVLSLERSPPADTRSGCPGLRCGTGGVRWALIRNIPSDTFRSAASLSNTPGSRSHGLFGNYSFCLHSLRACHEESGGRCILYLCATSPDRLRCHGAGYRLSLRSVHQPLSNRGLTNRWSARVGDKVTSPYQSARVAQLNR